MTSGLLQARIREATEARGFSQSRLLTHWEEIVGTRIAAMSRPVKVSYAKGGFGAVLTLLTTGAHAPMLQAEVPRIRERVNAVYGYSAIARIHVTQTAPGGFSEGRVAFERAAPKARPAPTPETLAEAKALSEGVQDESLRRALETFAGTFLARHRSQSKEDK
ncbi:hypothetical protein SAMN05443573_11980 [Celeribacter indicus]|nr:hypothetical protein SAMN05443573_11980 [Celeribacter indicus]